MKIAVLTEGLGSGGAERQACTLAAEFKRRGHDVCVATYHRSDYYRPLLERENVEHRLLGGRGRVPWAMRVRRFLRTHDQNVALAFLPGPSAYAELAGLPRRAWGLVVSERSAGLRGWAKSCLHTRADYIVTNSHSARIAIGTRHPRLESRLFTIYNAVNIEPSPLVAHVPHNSGEVRLLVAARVDRNKNARKLLEALDAVRNVQPSLRLSVDWYGNQEAEPDTVRETREAISHKNLGGIFRLHEPTDKIHDLMLRADTVVLPSYYEGLPNSICEGMALGKPILMSAVCDAGNLVQDGVSGFLFDPHSPRSIADAIARFVRLTPEERSHMGKASRARAEVLFDVKTVAGRYLRILEAAAERKRLKIEHWPKQVPETALRDSFQRRTT